MQDTVCHEECCPRSASNLWVSWHRYQRLWRYTPGIALSRSVMSFIAISKTSESWNAKSGVLSWLQAVPLTGSGCRIQDVLGSQEAIGFEWRVFVSRIGPSYHDRLEGQVSQIMRFVGDIMILLVTYTERAGTTSCELQSWLLQCFNQLSCPVPPFLHGQHACLLVMVARRAMPAKSAKICVSLPQAMDCTTGHHWKDQGKQKGPR